jgi:hypothetical protein
VVVEVLRARAVAADVVRAPPRAERIAEGGELSDEVVKLLVPKISIRPLRNWRASSLVFM